MPRREQASLPPIDPRAVNWNAVSRVTFSVDQRFSYDYPGPVRDLHQRLIVVPRPVHGDQRLRSYRVEADVRTVGRTEERDAFGNQVVSLHIPNVERSVVFTVTLEIERRAEQVSPVVPSDAVAWYLRPTACKRRRRRPLRLGPASVKTTPM
jgi:transglutaminase-like putative cysteine protease